MEILQNIWTALTTENEMLISIINVFFVFIEMKVTILLSITILNIKATKKQIFCYVLIVSIIAIFSTFFIPETYKIFITIILTPILIMFIFKTNFLKAILAEIFPMIVMAFCELLFIKLFSSIFSTPQDNMRVIPIYRETIALLDYLFIYILYRTVKYFKLNMKLIDNLDKKSKILLIINSILGLITVVLQLYLTGFYVQKLPIYIIITSIVSLLAYFTISIYSIINTSKLLVVNMDLSQEKEHNRILKLAQDDLHGFRHDFSNIMCTIGGYVQVKDMEGLTKYYSEIQKDITKLNNLSALNPKVINNPAIFTLIASKYDKAAELGIVMNVNCFLDLESLNMKIYEFTRILGILLDNAIEAAKECEEKIIHLEIRKDTNRNRQLLIIENTYLDKEIDTDKIFEKNYSTKSGNSGIGLWEVRQILKRNTNLNLFTTKDDKFFKQQLEMYNL